MKDLDILDVVDLAKSGYPMQEDTYQAYVKEAVSFIFRNIQNYNPELGPKALAALDNREAVLVKMHPVAIKALKDASKHRPSGGWRKLRASIRTLYLALGREDLAKKVAKTKNPTAINKRPRKTGRKKRRTTVTQLMFSSIFQELYKKEDNEALAMVVLARHLGLRPAEMIDHQKWGPPRCERRGDKLHVFVTGAKKTELGSKNPDMQRGIERELIVPYDPWIEWSIAATAPMTNKDRRNAQARIERLSKNLWTKSAKGAFCLYSLRYTLGSDLKASLAGDPDRRRKVAAVLGHKNTRSASDYGHAKAGSGARRNLPAASEETISRVVNNDESFGRAAARLAKAKVAQGKPIELSDVPLPPTTAPRRTAHRRPSGPSM